MSKHIAIYTTDKKYAKRIIDNLISKDTTAEVIKYVISSMEIRAELKDGSYYHLVSPNNNSRGIKPDISYIDIDTCPLDIIQNVIIPCNLKENFEIISSGRDNYDLDTFIDTLEKIRYIKGNLESVQVFDMKYYESNIMCISVENGKVIFST